MGFDLRNPVICALDLDSPKEALLMARAIGNRVGAYKIGPRLLLRGGQLMMDSLRLYAPVFVDFKFYDIPSTTLSAVQTAYDLGATFVTVHASAGPETLRVLAELEKDLQKERPFHILAVTILTSFSKDTLPSNLKDQTIEKHILDLCEDISDSGLSSIVCSAHELKTLKAKFPDLKKVTPGIRPSGESSDDQERVSTPLEAIKNGADALVVGRPIYQSDQPHKVVEEIVKSLYPA